MQKERKNIKKRKIILITVLVTVLVALLGTLAWYRLYSNRKIESEQTDVMAPYFLYLLNAGDEKSLEFTAGNLHPGETKKIVICVSNKAPEGEGNVNYEISRESEFAYELELAYTQNLPINYTVYQLKQVDGSTADDGTTADWIEVSEDTEGNTKKFTKIADKALEPENVDADRLASVFGDKWEETTTDQKTYSDDSTEIILDDTVNIGHYDNYTSGYLDTGESHRLELVTSVGSDGEVTYDRDYFLIEISWKSGIDFSDYTKETDLVNVIVRALQPKPTESTESTETVESTESSVEGE